MAHHLLRQQGVKPAYPLLETHRFLKAFVGNGMYELRVCGKLLYPARPAVYLRLVAFSSPLDKSLV